MQVNDARRVLRVLTAAFPTYPVGEDTAELYLAMLSNWGDADCAFEAAKRWALTEVRFPKPTELLAAIQEEARERAAANAPAYIEEGAGPVLPPEENARRLAELKAQLPSLLRRA